jgi:hypothetical protein
VIAISCISVAVTVTADSIVFIAITIDIVDDIVNGIVILIAVVFSVEKVQQILPQQQFLHVSEAPAKIEVVTRRLVVVVLVVVHSCHHSGVAFQKSWEFHIDVVMKVRKKPPEILPMIIAAAIVADIVAVVANTTAIVYQGVSIVATSIVSSIQESCLLVSHIVGLLVVALLRIREQ